MKPEQYASQFHALKTPDWYRARQAYKDGMLEAARLCAERAQWLTDNGHHALAKQSGALADAIESGAKGE